MPELETPQPQPEEESTWSKMEGIGRAIFGCNRAIKDPLILGLYGADAGIRAYPLKVNPAISAVCAVKDMYDMFTEDSRRKRDVAAMQLIIDTVGCIPGWGAIATGLDGVSRVGKLANDGESMAEYMADGLEWLTGWTANDELDPRYQPQGQGQLA